MLKHKQYKQFCYEKTTDCHNPPPDIGKNFVIKIMELKRLIKRCKMKMLLDLHHARPAPTDPGCRPAEADRRSRGSTGQPNLAPA
jgi:hypothetical protein